MDVSRRPAIRSRRPKKTVSREHFARLVLSLPQMPRKATRGPAGSLAFLLLLGGFGLGAWWPREASRPAVQEEVFVFEEEALQTLLPLGIPPPAPQPSAPPPKALKERAPKAEPPPKAPKEKVPKAEPPPKPQFGLEETDLSEAGDLAVGRGNTLAKEAEEVVAPPPPSPPSAPVFLNQQPSILKGIPPKYPPRALERGLEGTVVALVTIDINGRVTEARIEQGAGRDFDGPVLDAVHRLSFQPLIRQGRKWPARFRIRYEFKLE
jgi:periplasmic protein TonB